MKSIEIKNTMYVLDSIDDLVDMNEKSLCWAASEAINHAYAPYSNYKVGSAALLENGKIVIGSNQENAVYPLGLCAERVAIFSSSSQFPNVPIKAIAVKTNNKLSNGELPGFPCGSCRQSMIEMEQRFDTDIKLFVLGSDEKVYILNSAKDLMPFAFNQKTLKNGNN